MKKILPGFLIALVLLMGWSKFSLADEVNVNLTVKNNGDIVYSENVALLPAGTTSINDSDGNPHDTNADSVLSVVNTADTSSTEFNISNLIYYDSFGAFYLKCVTVSESELCDNWQYKVDSVDPGVGMDSKILSGGENIILYFGDENKEPEPEVETPPVHNSSNSSYKKSPKIILPSPIIPASPPVSPETIPPSPNINIEEKSKSILPTTPKKIIKKTDKITNQKIVTVVNTTPNTPSMIKTETPKKSWWGRFWDKIFSIF